MNRIRSIIAICAVILSALHAGAVRAECPLPRVRVGMAAVVAPGINQLNLRALPATDTGIVGQLYAGNALTVISEARCNRGYHWLRIELESGRRGWVAEGDWDAFYILPARDAETGYTPMPYEWSCPTVRRCPLM